MGIARRASGSNRWRGRGRLAVGVALVATMAACKQEDVQVSSKPGQRVTLRGELATGVECPMLVVSSDHRFSLSGDLGRFKAGDRVCVHGTIAAMSICMAGEATIAVTAIAPEDSCK